MPTVSTDPRDETIIRCHNGFKNAYARLKKNTALPPEKKVASSVALKALDKAFQFYLESTKRVSDFPVYVSRTDKLDARILLFFAMADRICKGDLSLPETIGKGNAQREVDYMQLGWPLEPETPSYAYWIDFIKNAAMIYQGSDVTLNLESWTGAGEAVTFFDELPGFLKPSENVDPSNLYENFIFTYDHLPINIKPLVDSLKKMHAYGLSLPVTTEKRAAALHLSVDLFQSLQTFYKLSPSDQSVQKETFVSFFKTVLHSKDNVMETHRTAWKNILANVLIALTGVGAIALGVNYLTTGHAFFHTTNSEKNVEEVDHVFSVVSCP